MQQSYTKTSDFFKLKKRSYQKIRSKSSSVKYLSTSLLSHSFIHESIAMSLEY